MTSLVDVTDIEVTPVIDDGIAVGVENVQVAVKKNDIVKYHKNEHAILLENQLKLLIIPFSITAFPRKQQQKQQKKVVQVVEQSSKLS